MRRVLFLVIQLTLAALAGYWGGQQVRPDTVIATAPPPSPPVAAPEPPRSAARAATAAANLSISYRLAVEHAAPSVVTVYSARTATVGPFGLGGRRLLSRGLG